MKWGLDWARKGDKAVFFTDLIGIEVFIEGIFDFLSAALASLLINRRLLFH